MADYKSPYALPASTMATYKPSTDFSALTGFDPYRNMATQSLAKSGTSSASTKAIKPFGSGLANWQEGMYGDNRYGYTDPTTGQQGSIELNASQLDAVNSPYAPASGASWFTENKDMINAGAQGLQALSGLANGYMASKNLKLAKDMFGFEKAATNRNIANQAQLVNNQIQNSGEVGMSLAGNTMDPNARAARQAQLDTMKVSGSPVG